MKHSLLKLLLLTRPMDTADQWRDALSSRVEIPEARDHEELEGSMRSEPSQAHLLDLRKLVLLNAVDVVVPHLSEYSILAPQLESLLQYCHAEYPVETERMLCIWLQRGSTLSGAFRTWFFEWLFNAKSHTFLELDDRCDSSGDDDRDDVREQQWQRALYVAAVQEEHVPLKRKLVQCLQERGALHESTLFGDSLDIEPKNRTQRVHHQSATRISSVEDLLDFYWEHAYALAPFALLCAVKLQAVAKRSETSSSTGNPGCLQLTEGVMVRLRWSKLLKPVLFDGLLRHCFALKVLQSTAATGTFDTHPALQHQVGEMGSSKRNAMLEHLRILTEQLDAACHAGMVHFHLNDSKALRFWSDSKDKAEGEALLQLTHSQQRRVLLDLERDLEDAPSSLFPHILLSLGLFVDALLRSSPTDSENDMLLAALRSLFTLFELRPDTQSCRFAAAVISDLRVIQHPIWMQAPALFAGLAESLNELLVLEPNSQKRWIVTMVLQQMLFECDLAVVQQCWSTFQTFLPKRLLRLTSIRLSSGTSHE